MIPSELLPFTAFVLIATPIAVVARAWFLHRSTVVRERARTERMRRALSQSAPDERAEILRALHTMETTPGDRESQTK
ncbi:hypothetical protein [Glycomyces tenuis]|uniref:hypothetical protein n=1 Tax=Glycomyces tenuis TaxID=58116 RepID=UPI00040F6814|nr:hypothetical protein [Glycomyces tenuis]